jgi:hypothetical protein
VRVLGKHRKKAFTDEERAAQAKSLFSEFLSAGDAGEALTLARELSAPGAPWAPLNFFLGVPICMQ